MNPWSHVTVLFTSTIQPIVFLRPLTWGMSCPLCIRLRSGDAVSPKTTGASVKPFKEISPARERLPSAPPAAGAVCLLQGFDRGPNCTASFDLQ